MSELDALLERFWSRVRLADGDACWEWIGPRDQDGYGRLYVGGHAQRAHRWIFEQLHGPLAATVFACHSARDAIAKGRRIPPRAPRPRTQCRRGHALSGDNVIVTSNGNGKVVRRCRACRTDQMRAWGKARPPRAGKQNPRPNLPAGTGGTREDRTTEL